MTVDRTSNLYIADTDNNRIRRMDASGAITTVAGNGVYGYSGDGGPATSAKLNQPHGLAVDAAGNLYIGDTLNNRIRRVDSSGLIATVVGSTWGDSGDGGPATSAQLRRPHGMVIDASGNLYIADRDNNRIRMVDANGAITTVAGNGRGGYSGDDGPATSAQIYNPYSVEVDGSGNLYIADTLNFRIRKVDASGIMTTVAGNGDYGYSGDNGPAISAQLYLPSGVAVDAGGNLYIADTGNKRIRLVKLQPEDPPPANQPPAASFTFTTEGLKAFFTSSSTDPEGGSLTYQWDFGDGGFSSEPNPAHYYSLAGSYPVTLKVADAKGLSSLATLEVSLTSLIVSVSYPPSLAQGLPLKVKVTTAAEAGITLTLGNLSETREGQAVEFSLDTQGLAPAFMT